MNAIEIQECENVLGTSNGVDMDDYFSYLNELTGETVENIKTKFKEFYNDETNWSF